jgi:hypothetical protein
VIRVIHVEPTGNGTWRAWAVRRHWPRFFVAYGLDRLEAVGRLVDRVEALGPWLSTKILIETIQY